MTFRIQQIRVVVDLVAAVLCVAGAIVVLAGTRGSITPFVPLAAAVFGCGWAITGWFEISDAAYAASLAIAAGIALLILASLVCLELSWWHPVLVVGVLLAVAAAGNAALSYRDARWASQ